MVQKEGGSEDDLLAVLDTGCNQTCHGALWFENYVKACGQEHHVLDESSSETLKGIGGKVRSLGKRVLSITLQLADGTLANGTVESSELEGSEAPLLMSCGAQRQLGLVLDLEERTAYSKVFGQNLDLVDRDGLPAVRLLPQHGDENQAFAMSAVGPAIAEDDEAIPLDAEDDFWEKGPDQCWIRHHVHPRRLLYDPRDEPTQEQDIEATVNETFFRKTVAINPETGEMAEFRDRWKNQKLEERDVEEYLGGPWTGYTYFYLDESHCHRSDVEATALNVEVEAADFVKFDEEKPVILTKGQKKQLVEQSEHLDRHDAAMWSELQAPKVGFSKSKRLLPRGCRSFLLEIFAGAATLTALAVGCGMQVSQPVDLQLDGGNLLDPKVRQQVWEQIEYEDPFLTAIAPVCAPWSSWQFVNFSKNDATAQKIMAERRLWCPVVEWVAKLVRHRTAQGRHVVLENPWLSLLWKLRCVEKLYGLEHPFTEELLEAVRFDQCQFGLVDLDTNLPHRKPTGMLTASKFIKEELSRTCPGDHVHQVLEGGRRTRLAAKWPEQLCKAVLRGAFRELQDLNCSVVFAAEGELEELEEFGTLDAIHGKDDLGELDFVTADPRELRREAGSH